MSCNDFDAASARAQADCRSLGNQTQIILQPIPLVACIPRLGVLLQVSVGIVNHVPFKDKVM